MTNQGFATGLNDPGTIIKRTMARRKVDFPDLVNRLEGVGVRVSEQCAKQKITRGVFSAAFFLQCLAALDCNELRTVDGVLRGVRHEIV